MNYTAIELKLRQVEEAFSRSRINVYSDPRKEKHYEELYALYEAINSIDLKLLTSGDVQNHYLLLQFILNGLEYLDSSTLNSIPYEIVSCLDYVLKEWTEEENFIIVTSLSNKHLQYLFHTFLNAETFNMYNQYIHNKYGLTISNRLIRITLPKSLSRDYLSSVVLYHELGHFVDVEFNVSRKILFKKYGADEGHEKELSHHMEYFADIFAAQYISGASNNFLKNITPPHLDHDSDTHPSTSKRIKVVEDFINGKVVEVLNEFNKVLHSSGKDSLKIRFQKIAPEKSEFNMLTPQEFQAVEELHYVFALGWDLWKNADNNFLREFDKRQRYHVINNLVEKSISNFTILEKWRKNGGS